MSFLVVNAPRRPAGPSWVPMRKPRAHGQGDIADAIMGVATTALQIAAAERQAYLAKKQAEAVAKAQQAAAVAAAQAAQQQAEQQRLAQEAQLEAMRNAAAPSGLGLGVSGGSSGMISIFGAQVPTGLFWGALGVAGALLTAKALRR